MAVALAVALSMLLAPGASASKSLRLGIFDDGVVLYQSRQLERQDEPNRRRQR